MEIEEGQAVLCTVTKIVGTTVFVRLDNYNREATIMTAEIAPGRIRNLRDYVVPNKKIVCRILRVGNKGQIDLSLRRVTAKERNETLEIDKKEKSLVATLKRIVENPEIVIEKIKQKSSLVEFFEQVKENPKLLEELMPKQEAEKILKIINEKKEKEVYVKKKFSLSSRAEDGIKKIKSILPQETTYIAAGKFSIEIKDSNYKDANRRIDDLLKNIEEQAKKNGCTFALLK
jgi:translation initiation factor 2 alpha subunit (eIF-2alpha)